MSVVALEAVTKRYGARAVVDQVSVAVERGEILALLGPSGSGKSTILRLIAGLELPDAGTISLDGQIVAGRGRFVAPERRRVGLVFQSFALFPHLSVGDNVGFGAADPRRVDELLGLVQLASRRASPVHALSGGEQQRVALARALAAAPRVLLLDEPFANLDAALRRRLRDEVAQTLRAVDATAVLVTHDASEAFALADRVAVLADGCILQIGAPEDVYRAPATREIAERTGEVALLRGRVRADGAVTCGLGALALVRPLPPDSDAIVVLRPEALALDDAGAKARVVRRVFEGASTLLELAVGDERLTLRAAGAVAARPGAHVRVSAHEPVCAFPA